MMNIITTITTKSQIITIVTIITIITDEGEKDGSRVGFEGGVFAARNNTYLLSVGHVEEQFSDGTWVFVEEGGDFSRGEGDGVMFFEEDEDVLAFLRETIVGGGTDEGPGHGIGGKAYSKFFIREASADNVEGGIGVTVVPFEYEDSVGEGCGYGLDIGESAHCFGSK